MSFAQGLLLAGQCSMLEMTPSTAVPGRPFISVLLLRP